MKTIELSDMDSTKPKRKFNKNLVYVNGEVYNMRDPNPYKDSSIPSSSKLHNVKVFDLLDLDDDKLIESYIKKAVACDVAMDVGVMVVETTQGGKHKTKRYGEKYFINKCEILLISAVDLIQFSSKIDLYSIKRKSSTEIGCHRVIHDRDSKVIRSKQEVRNSKKTVTFPLTALMFGIFGLERLSRSGAPWQYNKKKQFRDYRRPLFNFANAGKEETFYEYDSLESFESTCEYTAGARRVKKAASLYSEYMENKHGNIFAAVESKDTSPVPKKRKSTNTIKAKMNYFFMSIDDKVQLVTLHKGLPLTYEQRLEILRGKLSRPNFFRIFRQSLSTKIVKAIQKFQHHGELIPIVQDNQKKTTITINDEELSYSEYLAMVEDEISENRIDNVYEALTEIENNQGSEEKNRLTDQFKRLNDI